MTTRRGLLRGLGATLVCAPAIVRVGSLMALPRPLHASYSASVIDTNGLLTVEWITEETVRLWKHNLTRLPEYLYSPGITFTPREDSDPHANI